ncbi:MAG: BatD family protein [Tannerella sp.]|nr:BatD family protein [Tannerella sp.]
MKKIILLIFLAVTSGVTLDAQDITFKATAPPAVPLGAQFKLAYSINALNVTDLRVPSAISENFDVLAGPTPSIGRSVTIINGSSSSIASTTYTYVLAAKKEGAFDFEPATIKIGNSEYKSNALSIKVLPADQPQAGQNGGQQSAGGGNQAGTSNTISNDDVFVRMIVSDRSVYEQEGFLVTFKLYTAVNIADVSEVKFPEFEGFHSSEIEQGNVQWILENYNGRNYQCAIMRQSILYPQRSGKLTIGSAKMKATLRIRKPSRGRSIFEDFFGDTQDISKELVSQPVTIDVKPLPSGKPASFSNAVGNFSMTSSINATTLKVNEAVTVKLTIKGNGDIKLIKNPELKFPNDFEIHDPIPHIDFRTTAAGVSGTKTIEYMAIPRFAGDFVIPSVAFSYFDAKSGEYKTLPSEEYHLHVEKGEGGSDAPVVSNFTNRESLQFLGKDIRYIKIDKPHFIENKDIFFGSFMYLLAYLMITVLFIVFFIIYRKQVKENANIALVRTKKANKTAVKRLKQAEKLLKENKEEPFYEEILRALWGYLSDKLNIPQSELTKENVSVELSKYGVGEVLINEFLDIINTCEYARYAPNKSSGAMDKLFGETVDAIGKMENTIKK